MLYAEFHRFLQSLKDKRAPTQVCKISNLVLSNLQDLLPLGTHQGQRIKRIVELSTAQWDSLDTEIHCPREPVAVSSSAVTRLTELKVGPFRGFSREETFDLNSRLVLIYGPNGTGKSSFCEALEYSLLGSVEEADNKRFRTQTEYLKNAYTDSFSTPQLKALAGQDEERPIESNETLYRFCFVEKNRIDNFSRIAAKAPSKQTELISTLFGLDSFNEFVKNFSSEIDGRYLDLVGRKSLILQRKREKLEAYERQLETAQSDLKKIEHEESKLAASYCAGKTFQQMDVEIHGTAERPGTLDQLEHQLRQPTKRKSNVTLKDLEEISEKICSLKAALTEKISELSEASRQVSFKNMFEALSQLERLGLDMCPACNTPLEKVSVNPFTHASEELEKLSHLAGLQESEKRLREQVGQSLHRLSEIVNACAAWFPQSPIHAFVLESGQSVPANWWDSLHEQLEDGCTPFQHLKANVRRMESEDAMADKENHLRAPKLARLKELKKFSAQIIELKSSKRATEQSANTARIALENFEKENEQLIAETREEASVVERNQEIADGYAKFVSSLNEHKDALPGKLIADLGNQVVDLYNSFNRNDVASEKLSEVRLPLIQNQRLEVAFQSEPERLFDALHVLSEGHIRCMGLAILLAKNLKETCPILVFDDPVNAIDDDHRESIRRTLFEDEHFANKQIILTCHGEEFFKDISNLLPAQMVAHSKTLSFLPRVDEPHIRVDFNISPRNYILAARGHFDRNEIRDSLAKSRQALETLTKGKMWRYVARHGDGNLSIKLRGPKAPIELRNLSDQLKKQIGKDNFSDQDKHRVYEPLAALLGISGDSREWRYLNKGVHEEENREEFDRHTVHEVITQLEALDAALA